VTVSSRALGFTIIEVLVAVTILSLGILAVSAHIQRLADDIRTSHLAIQLDVRARSLTDSLRAAGYHGLLPGGPPVGVAGLHVSQDSLGLKEIVVTVTGQISGTGASDTLATRLFYR